MLRYDSYIASPCHAKDRNPVSGRRAVLHVLPYWPFSSIVLCLQKKLRGCYDKNGWHGHMCRCCPLHTDIFPDSGITMRCIDVSHLFRFVFDVILEFLEQHTLKCDCLSFYFTDTIGYLTVWLRSLRGNWQRAFEVMGRDSSRTIYFLDNEVMLCFY